jgi:hypothetical protein
MNCKISDINSNGVDRRNESTHDGNLIRFRPPRIDMPSPSSAVQMEQGELD